MMSDGFRNHERVEGVLYLEDFFAAEPEVVPEDAGQDHDIIPEPRITESDLNAARSEGFAAGVASCREQYEAELAQLTAVHERNVDTMMRSVLEKMDEGAQKAAGKLVRAVESVVYEIFPTTASVYDEAEREKIIKKSSGIIRRSESVVIFSNIIDCQYFTSCVEKMGVKNIEFRVDENIPSGDFRIVWDDGEIFRNARKIIEELRLSIFPPCNENRGNSQEKNFHD